ncbi:MAG: hypothetical protein K0Q79_1437 [Flavipsychrobacter sp.]|jgi:hypothetical protein|nr:hypothetical protein [Flavipsychrobacter sp.]
MKTALIITLLCIASISGYAQLKQYKYTTNDHPKLKAGQRIPLTPAFNQPFTVVKEPACYLYKTPKGLEVMECPGILFAEAPSLGIVVNGRNDAGDRAVTTDNANIRSERAYLGNYPHRSALQKDIPRVEIPANATPAYPTTQYIQLTDPPCYTYTNKRGLEVMECHGALFPPQR